MNFATNPTAQAVDNTLIYIFGFSLLLLLGITVATIYFVIKYRRSKYPQPTSEVSHSFWLETIWTVLPTLIVLTMFWVGWSNYLGLREVPEGALEVKATARMWSWQFEYPDGKRAKKLYVPVGQPVKVTMTSVDVLHNFFAPAFRVKRDAVPGMESYLWFQATEPGSYDIFCAEYCGTGHADMITTIEALPEAEFAAWSQPAAPSSEPRGLTVLNDQGCTGCHSLDGSEGIAPSLYQLSGQKRKLLVDGKPREITIDAAYLKKAIREPEAELVEGYDPLMPAYDEGVISDVDLQAVVDYLLGKAAPTAPAVSEPGGVQLLDDHGCTGCHSLDGSKGIGPSLYQLAGQKRKLVINGKTSEVTIDAAYLRKAIREPAAELVEGYPPMMPAYDADTISDAELLKMVDHLLGTAAPKVPAAAPVKPKLDGAQLLEDNGCLGCHSLDGSKGIAPTFKGMGGRQTTIVRNGEKLTIPVDAEYLRRALLQPKADLVEGYAPMMPAADYLAEEEIEAIIEHLLKQ